MEIYRKIGLDFSFFPQKEVCTLSAALCAALVLNKVLFNGQTMVDTLKINL